MKSRYRPGFRPGLATPIGVDYLEYRQLLSAVGTAGEVAEVDRTRMVVSPANASRNDTGTSNSQDPSGDKSGDAGNTAGSGGAASDIRVQPAASPAGPTGSEGDAAPGDAGEVVVHPGAVPGQPSSSNAANVDSGVGPWVSVEQSPGDEGPTGPPSDSSVADPPGDISSPIGAGVAPDRTAAASPSAASADPPSAPAPGPAGIVVGAGAPARLAIGGPTAFETESGGPLPTLDGASTATVRAASAGVWAALGSDMLESGTRSHGDGDPMENRAVEESAPPPRCADLLTEFVPFGRATLEDAIDRFLAPIEDIGAELANWQSPASLIRVATIVAAAAMVSGVMRRQARLDRMAREEGEEDLARFPGYPSAWSPAES